MREMKDSGVPWIGNIPADWNVSIVLSEFEEVKNINKGMLEKNLLSLSYGNIVRKEINSNNGLLPDSFETYNIIPQNSLVLRLTDLQNDKRSLRSAICNETGIITSAYTTIQLTSDIESHPRYMNYLFRCYDNCKVFYSLGNGVRQSINYAELKRVAILKPSYNCQVQIAKYLDDKCTQIDTIIAKEQSVIEKMQEYRQSIITETVTSGLDSTTNLVSSGVEWIAKIPLNWKITRFTKSFEFFKGLNIKKTDLVDSGAGVVSYGQVHAKNNNGYSLQADLIRYVAENLIDEKSLLQEGDFVFADTSEDLEGVGNCIHIDSSNELYAGYHTLVARCLDESICTKYFAFLFLTDIWRSQLRKNANGTKVYSVTQKMFKAVSCLVPPIEEQLKIVAYLEKKCDSIDRVISDKLTIIDTLTEYKKSLIYEVVTGKKEVPHV